MDYHKFSHLLIVYHPYSIYGGVNALHVIDVGVYDRRGATYCFKQYCHDVTQQPREDTRIYVMIIQVYHICNCPLCIIL
jgi:hypothetical protein